MKRFSKIIEFSIFVLLISLLTIGLSFAQSTPDGSKERPLRVILIPADGGTEDGTKADFQPIFNAITKMTGIHFDIKVAQTYSAAVEAMCSRVADIAWFGAVTFIQAHKRGCATLLAISVDKGQSTYYSGLFIKADSPLKSIKDVKGKKVAFGDVNSTSSFVYPVAMLLDAGINPARDLGVIRMTGSHVNSLKALEEGLVDISAASFESYEKAVNQGAIDPKKIKVLVKSEPIPNPPVAMHPMLAKEHQNKLREAFNNVHKAGISPEMIRGYGGKKVDRYDSNISLDVILTAGKKLDLVNDKIKSEILVKSGAR